MASGGGAVSRRICKEKSKNGRLWGEGKTVRSKMNGVGGRERTADGSAKKIQKGGVWGEDMLRECKNQKGSGRQKKAGYDINEHLGFSEDGGCRRVGVRWRLGRSDTESRRSDEMSTQQPIQNHDLRPVPPVRWLHQVHQAQSEIFADVPSHLIQYYLTPLHSPGFVLTVCLPTTT